METKWYQKKDSLLKGEVPKKYRILSEILSRIAPGKRMLDIGCNAGLVSMLAAQNGAGRVTGIDKREHFVEQAVFLLDHWKKNGYLHTDADVRFRLGDATERPELVDDHDLFVLIRVIYHLKDGVARVFERLSEREDAVVLIQGNAARADKAREEPGPHGNKLALAENLLPFVERYGFQGVDLGQEIVVARHERGTLDLNNVLPR